MWRYEFDNCSFLGITRAEFMRLTMRDLEYKINGRQLDLYAGSRIVAGVFAGVKPSDVVDLWIDEIQEENRAELVKELKSQGWVKKILSNGRQ